MTLPLVSVIIPVHNRSNLVLRLLDSLRNQVRLGQIVIVNDCSSDIDTQVLRTIEGVKYLENKGNEGFVKSCRRGASKADHEYLLFLNSDTEAYHNHCLEHMASNLDDGASVCGALLLYPKADPYRPESIQHCGVFFDATGFPRHIMSGYPANTPMALVRRVVPAVTGASFMTTKAWWDKIGGFDLKLSPGTFEDVSYCITANQLGGQVIYDPRATFAHHEHASQNSDGGWFTSENISRNFNYLTLKHGKLPPSDEFWFKGI